MAVSPRFRPRAGLVQFHALDSAIKANENRILESLLGRVINSLSLIAHGELQQRMQTADGTPLRAERRSMGGNQRAAAWASGHVGVTARDNRPFVEAVLDRYRAGIPWRDLPERFGDFRGLHLHHSRWSKTGGGFACLKHWRTRAGDRDPAQGRKNRRDSFTQHAQRTAQPRPRSLSIRPAIRSRASSLGSGNAGPLPPATTRPLAISLVPSAWPLQSFGSIDDAP